MILYSVHPLKPKWNSKFLYNWQSVRLGVDRLCGAHDQILFIISHHFLFDHQSSLAILYQQSHLVVRQEKHSEEITVEFYLRTISIMLVAFRNMPKIFRHGAEGFTSPPKESVLRIFIALKNSPPSAECEPPNLGSNGKHANHYITEGDARLLS
jgi:hypothetical protein